MELKKPLESVGWLSGSGYQVVIDERARAEAEALKERSKENTDGESARSS